MRSSDINKGDFVIEKKIDWVYWTPEHQHNDVKERIIKKGVVIAKSKFGVLVNWDSGCIKSEWIQFKDFDRNLGYVIPGMKSNTYTRYEKTN